MAIALHEFAPVIVAKNCTASRSPKLARDGKRRCEKFAPRVISFYLKKRYFTRYNENLLDNVKETTMTQEATQETTAKEAILIVAAHVGDFVWRAGGAIALHAEAGHPVSILCLSYGENGESNAAWAASGSTLEAVKATRRQEAERAAETLGASAIAFLNAGDYPMVPTPALVDAIAREMRRTRPALVLTHTERDPSNLDHCKTHTMVLEARMKAIAPGHGGDFIAPPQIMCFEPHQSELCDFKPTVLLDISAVWEKKRTAMECVSTQKNLWAFYTRLAQQRGAQAGRRADAVVTHGEAYFPIFPQPRKTLV
jgi:4-oxalomesaconate hydratase